MYVFFYLHLVDFQQGGPRTDPYKWSSGTPTPKKKGFTGGIYPPEVSGGTWVPSYKCFFGLYPTWILWGI